MKRLTQVRIVNGICLTLLIAIGLMSLASSDGNNRYWDGKAFGGAIAIIALVLIIMTAVAISTYRETRDIHKVGEVIKEVALGILSYDWLKRTHKKRKRK